MSPRSAAHGKSLIGFSMSARPATMNRITVYVSMFGACAFHAAAPVMIRTMPTKKPKNETIFVSMLAVVPTTGTGLKTLCRNHDIAIKPPIMRMYWALLTRMLKSIFFTGSRFCVMLFCAV